MALRNLAWSILVAAAAGLAAPTAHAQEAAAPPTDHDRALQCMTLAIAYEAGFEPASGQQAVAEVILNRTRHPAYPKSVCGVVFQGSQRRTGCQFTFTCDGALARPVLQRVMLASREVARSVLSGEVAPQVGGATHYHANYVSPYWAPSLIRIGRIGAHIFYRAPGSIDAPARYAGGVEPAIGALGTWLSAPDALTRRGTEQPPAAPAAPSLPAFSPWGLVVK